MTMPPTFSILMPVYNHEDYVREALDSVLAQTDPDWEAIVIDDGSTDGTGAVVDDYATRDARIRVFHQENGGQGRALNAALRRATGEWICWLSSDDLFKPDKLATHRRYFEEDPDCRFFFTAFDVLQEDTGTVEDGPAEFNAPPESRWRLLRLLSHNYINGITICVHRAVFEAVGEFEPRYRYAQDYDLYMRIMRSNRARFLEERTCVKRCHGRQWAVVERLAMFYQCSEAAIRFLNTCPFEGLFPRMDLSRAESAKDAVEQALDIALSSHAYVNRLGVHPALLGRIVEWVTNGLSGTKRAAARFALWDLREAVVAARGAFRQGLYLAARIAIASAAPQAYVPTTPQDVARGSLGRAVAGSEEAVELERFLVYLEADAQGMHPEVQQGEWRTVLAAGGLDGEQAENRLREVATGSDCVVALAPWAKGLSIDGNLVLVHGAGGFGQDLACAACGPFDLLTCAGRTSALLRAVASRRPALPYAAIGFARLVQRLRGAV